MYTTTYDFDQIIDRRRTDSVKWRAYPDGVIPLYAADMDFLPPIEIAQALNARIAEGMFGYPVESQELRELFAARLQRLHGWQVNPESVVYIPRIATGVNIACQTAGAAGDALLVPTPLYGLLPLFAAAGFVAQEVELSRRGDGHYVMDFDALEAAITERTRMFFLCNPHNPVGRVYTRPELERIAELCQRHDLVICSDDVYSDLVFSGCAYTPIASIAKEIADRTITLLGPGKTYNIAGLRCAMAVITNPTLRERFQRVIAGSGAEVNILGYVGALAAYRHGDDWLAQALRYLEQNRHVLCQYVTDHMPEIRVIKPEGTYVAWVDCRRSVPGNPAEFFLRRARVALNDGLTFGKGGQGFVRLVFGSPRAILLDALDRMYEALIEAQNTRHAQDVKL